MSDIQTKGGGTPHRKNVHTSLMNNWGGDTAQQCKKIDLNFQVRLGGGTTAYLGGATAYLVGSHCLSGDWSNEYSTTSWLHLAS